MRGRAGGWVMVAGAGHRKGPPAGKLSPSERRAAAPQDRTAPTGFQPARVQGPAPASCQRLPRALDRAPPPHSERSGCRWGRVLPCPGQLGVLHGPRTVARDPHLHLHGDHHRDEPLLQLLENHQLLQGQAAQPVRGGLGSAATTPSHAGPWPSTPLLQAQGHSCRLAVTSPRSPGPGSARLGAREVQQAGSPLNGGGSVHR